MASTTSNLTLQARAIGEPRELDLLPRIEAALAEPLFEGMSVGPTLTDPIVIELICKNGKWNSTLRWKDRLNWIRHQWIARQSRPKIREYPADKILFTWRHCTPRINELIAPVIEEIGPHRTAVIYQSANV